MRNPGLLALVLVGIVAACNSNDGSQGASPPAATQIDCVAVLGAPPPSEQTPLAGIPYSGLPREKRIADLTTDELGALCDFGACLGTNGYARNCYGNGRAEFHLETVDLVAEAMLTCMPNPTPGRGMDDVSLGTRADCISLYQGYFGACHVGSSEDCIRERVSDPLAAPSWAPSCAITKAECPIN